MMKETEQSNNDKNTTIHELKEKIIEFRDKRDWKQFHKLKDLTLAMSIEVGEILEHFRYKTDEEILDYLKDPNKKQEVSHEMADVLYHLLLLSEEMDFDISTAFLDKLKLIEGKYPVEKCKGKPFKYTEYEEK